MATSGSIDFSVSRDDIIKAAYRMVLVDEDFSPSTNQTANAAILLNSIVKSWTATIGVPLWALDSAVVLPVTGTNSISFGASGGHVTESYVSTTLTADSAVNDTTIDVSSATGIANTYAIGVELDNGDMHWTTVNGAPSGTTVTLTTGVTSAATTGNRVYCYQTKAPRALRITHAVAREVSSSIDVPVRIVTSHEWLDYTNKSSEANYPLAISYVPLLDNGQVRVWPRWSSGDYILVLQYHRPLEDFDASGDTPDFPQEYYLPLIYALAVSLAPTYNMEANKFALLKREAKEWLEKVSDNDYEEGSIYFQPNRTMSRI